MKTKVLLHGGFTKKENESNDSFFREFAKDIPNNGIVLIVLFAAREEITEERFEEFCDKFRAQAPEKTLQFEIATKESLLEQLEKADAIYIQGGSTNKLLATLREYDQDILKSTLQGKTVAGSSAGAYAIAQAGASHDKPEVRDGLGILPVRVVCHYQSPE